MERKPGASVEISITTPRVAGAHRHGMLLSRDLAKQGKQIFDQRAGHASVGLDLRKGAGQLQPNAGAGTRGESLGNQFLDIDGVIRRGSKRLGQVQSVRQNPVGLFNQMLQAIELFVGFLIVARKHQREVVGNRFDGAERLAKVVREVA